jgi:cytochrome c553
MRSFLTIAGLALAFATQASESVAIKRGVELVKDKGCVSCHGEDGNGAILPATGKIDPQYPILAGQYADYLEYSLRGYRSGDRQNDVMKGFAEQLTDAEIKELANYFAKQKSALHTLKGMD